MILLCCKGASATLSVAKHGLATFPSATAKRPHVDLSSKSQREPFATGNAKTEESSSKDLKKTAKRPWTSDGIQVSAFDRAFLDSTFAPEDVIDAMSKCFGPNPTDIQKAVAEFIVAVIYAPVNNAEHFW
jgi:hypothetical protein